jgi:hypothetical protein
MATFKIIKFVYDKELNNDNAKTYATKEAANNAGRSWTEDCTVHAEIRKGRWFEIVEIN